MSSSGEHSGQVEITASKGVQIGNENSQTNYFIQEYIDQRGIDGTAGLLDGPVSRSESPRWRVFISHTSELREFPEGNSYVAAAERAVSAAGHVIVDMKDFPAASQSPAQLCAERVRGCDVYLGVLGTRYGSIVPDRPQVSYTELEFDIASEAGMPRLVFVLDTAAVNVGIPVSVLVDTEFGGRQSAFCSRVQGSGLVTQAFADPATLGQLVERSLRELADVSFSGEKDPGKEPLRDVGISPPKFEGLVLRVSTTNRDGELQNIEFFNLAIAEHWFKNYHRGRTDSPGAIDDK